MGWSFGHATHYKTNGQVDRKAEMDSIYTWANPTGMRVSVVEGQSKRVLVQRHSPTHRYPAATNDHSSARISPATYSAEIPPHGSQQRPAQHALPKHHADVGASPLP